MILLNSQDRIIAKGDTRVIFSLCAQLRKAKFDHLVKDLCSLFVDLFIYSEVLESLGYSLLVVDKAFVEGINVVVAWFKPRPKVDWLVGNQDQLMKYHADPRWEIGAASISVSPSNLQS